MIIPYNQDKHSAEEFQKMLAKKLLEAELQLLEKEKASLIESINISADKINIEKALFQLELRKRKKKEEYAKNLITIYDNNNNFYNNY